MADASGSSQPSRPNRPASASSAWRTLFQTGVEINTSPARASSSTIAIPAIKIASLGLYFPRKAPVPAQVRATSPKTQADNPAVKNKTSPSSQRLARASAGRDSGSETGTETFFIWRLTFFGRCQQARDEKSPR